MKEERFIVAFPPLSETHLNKDVGGIPIALNKYWGIDFHFIGGTSTPKGKTFTTATLCDSPIGLIRNIGFLYTLIQEVHVGDIVNIYHLSRMSALIIFILRLLYGRRIKIYLKLDMNTKESSLRLANAIARSKNARNMKEYYSSIVGRWICRNADVMSAESTTVFSLSRLWPTRTMLKIPNGLFEEEIQEYSERTSNDRTQRIVSVARHGSIEKRSENLLQAFATARISESWSLLLVGDYSQEFKQLVDETVERRPQLKERVVLLGAIRKRSELIGILANSKIFAAVSSYEGFSLALIEAAASGCFCVTTNTGGASDVIGDDGILLTPNANTESIASALEEAVSKSTDFDHSDFARRIASRFNWKAILQPLVQSLNFDCDRTATKNG